MDQSDIDRRTEKQIFLRDQISEQKLDPEKFKVFCLEQSDQGGNIDHWTLQELKQLVESFNQQNDQYRNRMDESQKRMDNDQQNIKKVQNDGLLVDSQTDGNQQKEYELIQECKKIEHTPVSEALSTSIRITSRRLVKNGFFKQNYVEYELVTDELDWTVIRRYSDFDLLNQTLQKLFPGVVLPALPKKHWQRNLEEYYLIKRQYHLQKYINQIVNHPLVSRAYCILDFLKINDYKQWQMARSHMNQVQKITDIGNTYSLDGQQKSSIKLDQEIYLRQFNLYLNKNSPILKRVQNHSKQLYLAFDSVSSILREMESEFSILHNNIDDFNKNQSETQNVDDQFQIYQILKDQHRKWAEEIETQMQLIQYQYMFFYGHLKNNNIKLQQYFTDKFSLGQQLRNKQNKLMKTKEKLFSQGYSQKWQLDQSMNDLQEIQNDKSRAMQCMLPQETESIRNMKNLFGMYNQSLNDECLRFNQHYKQQLIDNVIQTNTKYSELMFQSKQNRDHNLNQVQNINQESQ